MSTTHLENLKSIVGASNCLFEDGDTRAYTTDYRRVFHGKALAVVRPADTLEVSKVMAYCHAERIPIVPQGGNTSLMGGAVPDAAGSTVVLSLSRLNNVRQVDVVNDTMVVEAGVTLSQARSIADEADRLFPLRIGSEGSCQIGGNLSTNAGGTAVLRYGNMRDLVLGVEVVLPDGQVWDGLRALRKDNTGYDMKHLFIGSEGTLGIVTAAVLKLWSKPLSTSTAFVGIESPSAALSFFAAARARLGHDITAFELISAEALELVLGYLGEMNSPLALSCPWYVLAEMSSSSAQADLDASFHDVLQAGMDKGWGLDAAIATTQAQAANFWRIREEISDAQTKTGGSVRCDISVPLSSIPKLIELGTACVVRHAPRTRMIVYGHMGDGNVHFNPLRPVDVAAADYVAEFGDVITHELDEIAMSLRGSISAEHGVGVAKRDELLVVKSRVELEMAWRIKSAFDPENLLNPGKMLPAYDAVFALNTSMCAPKSK
jgi:FAD/FMN-containing dehydrogenase